jgi:hypothetical protein
MGTCILCGDTVSIDSGTAWKITPVRGVASGLEPMHWIHSGCIDRAHAATLRDTQRPTLRTVA